ncbi:class I SAM-dependent DNA methyltransferase [Nonomuraea sp. NPDC004297]
MGDSAFDPFLTLGETYEEVYGQIPEQLAALAWLTERLPPGAPVLDVGSGTGRPTADTLVHAGLDVLGIDVSATMLGLARSRVPDARFEQHDVRDFRSPPGSFTAVCAFFSLLSMPRPDIVTTLSRIHDWLTPGGYLLLGTVCGDWDGHETEWLGRRESITSFPADEYERRLRQAGFDLLHRETVPFTRPNTSAREEHLFCYARRAPVAAGAS